MPDDHALCPSDAELTAEIKELRSDAPVDELYRRHRSAVLAYALTCCHDPHTAEDLVSEAFARTLQAVRAGSGPAAAWRPYLLTVVRRIATDWAGTARRTELSPDFEEWLASLPGTPEAESGEERVLRLEDNNLVLRAFRSLPERWQIVLWHTAVEEEPASTVGALLGMGASGVGSLASRAREGLREAYLAAHVANASDTDECRRYSSLLSAAVRRAGRRPNKDLERHLADCVRCRRALTELTCLNERLGSLLPTAVLLWGGSAYMTARVTEAAASAGGAAITPGAPDGAGYLDGGTTWWARAKGATFGSGAVAGSVVAAIGIALLVLPIPPFSADGGKESPSMRAASNPPMRVNPPPVTPMPSRPSPPEPSATAPDTASKQPSAQPSAPAADGSPPSTATQSAGAGQASQAGKFGACFDGNCEVEVTTGDTIPLDGKKGVDEYRVSSVADNILEWNAYTYGEAQGYGGYMGAPNSGTIHNLVVDLISIDGDRARIRMS
ncbi:sigma-70 family RNA polymerase sigma factor [Streptomyces sp.]|uniref:RNA polymerase sigma factor n=1 Tax=Streptomyces sp. TaxID=1931 RepID=UPI002D7736A8|nr:sigma-70 family RNA polymerase sigma factor [Streptomyces sp.]HET6357959.1 sigma-70 family RNA polymerase sigma factor [Streptomyces sp.]